MGLNKDMFIFFLFKGIFSGSLLTKKLQSFLICNEVKTQENSSNEG